MITMFNKSRSLSLYSLLAKPAFTCSNVYPEQADLKSQIRCGSHGMDDFSERWCRLLRTIEELKKHFSPFVFLKDDIIVNGLLYDRDHNIWITRKTAVFIYFFRHFKMHCY